MSTRIKNIELPTQLTDHTTITLDAKERIEHINLYASGGTCDLNGYNLTVNITPVSENPQVFTVGNQIAFTYDSTTASGPGTSEVVILDNPLPRGMWKGSQDWIMFGAISENTASWSTAIIPAIGRGDYFPMNDLAHTNFGIVNMLLSPVNNLAAPLSSFLGVSAGVIQNAGLGMTGNQLKKIHIHAEGRYDATGVGAPNVDLTLTYTNANVNGGSPVTLFTRPSQSPTFNDHWELDVEIDIRAFNPLGLSNGIIKSVMEDTKDSTYTIERHVDTAVQGTSLSFDFITSSSTFTLTASQQGGAIMGVLLDKFTIEAKNSQA